MRLLIGLILFLMSSCTTYKATVKSRKDENVKFSAIKVYPDWTYQKSHGKWVAPLTGVAAGVSLGLTNKLIVDKGYNQAQNATALALYGLVVGGATNLFVFAKAKNYKFEMSHSEKWLKEYNKALQTNYFIHSKGADNSLVLVPGSVLENLKAGYNTNTQEIQDGKLTLRQLVALRNAAPEKYGYLLPYETEQLIQLIDSKKAGVAGKELMTKAFLSSKSEISYSLLKQLKAFNEENSLLYTHADASAKTAANEMIREKTKLTLRTLLDEEKTKIRLLPEGEEGIIRINALFADFNNKYGPFSKEHQEIQEAFALIFQKKTEIIGKLAPALRSRLTASSFIKDIEQMEGYYLANTDASDLRIIELGRLANQRKSDIKYAEAKAVEDARRFKEEKLRLAEERGPRFITKGLDDELMIRNIFRGHFNQLSFERSEVTFSIVLHAYINQYWSYCSKSLPSNSIQLTSRECQTERVTRNSWGVEISRVCISWVDVPTGVFASPTMYSAKNAIDVPQTMNMVGTVMDYLSGKKDFGNILGDIFGSAIKVVIDKNSINNDMRLMINQNGCTSEGLKRFEANLVNFAHDRSAIRIED